MIKDAMIVVCRYCKLCVIVLTLFSRIIVVICDDSIYWVDYNYLISILLEQTEHRKCRVEFLFPCKNIENIPLVGGIQGSCAADPQKRFAPSKFLENQSDRIVYRKSHFGLLLLVLPRSRA